MEDEYMEQQDVESGNRNTNDGNDSVGDISKEFVEGGYEEGYEDEEGGNNFRGNNRMRGNFRNRGRGMPPPGWMNGPPPPMRFRGRGYGPSGPPMRGRGFFRGRGGPRGFNNGPNFDNNWGPMGPPPPGMMGGPPPFGPPPGMMPPGGPMGPPPNMMQPPPFGGPPGMPPPNMQPAELWVEAKSDEGKSYYYHSRTRETTWTRPQDSANCKVVTQTEMEAMAAAGQLPGMGGATMQMNGPMGGMGGPPMGSMPNGVMQGGPNAGMPPFMQPPPWVKEAASDKEMLRGDVSPDNDDSSSEQPMLQPPNGSMMAFPNNQNPPITTSNSLPGGPMQGGMMAMQNLPGVPMGGPLGGPPIGGPGVPMGGPGGPLGGPGGPLGGPGGPLGGPGAMPGQGGPGGPMAPGGPGGPMGGPGGPMGGPGGPGAPWGGWGGWPPPLNNQPPGTMLQPGRVAAGTPSGGQAPTSHQGSAPGSAGALAQTQKQEMVMTAELQAAASEWSTHRAPDGRPYYYHAGKQLSVWEKPPPIKQLEEIQAKITLEKGGKPEPQIERKKMEIDESKIEVIDLDADDDAKAEAVALAEAERQADEEREQKEQAEREQAEREKAEREKAEKEKADKEKAKQDRSRPISTTPISGTPWCVVWTGDGLVFFYNPTARLSVWERPAALANRADVDRAVAQPPQAVKELSALNNAAAAKASNGDKRPANTDSDSDVEPAKKTKQEEPKKMTVLQRADSSTEAEIAAAQQRAKVPFDIRAEAFTKLMVEKQVSAFSTWEKELHKIVFDQRYLMLNCKERKQVFDKFVRDRAEAERKEKRNRLQQMKQAFRQLMEEAKLHSKSSYSDFASKHSREERFKAIEKARDREVYFNEYIAEVRKKEKEDREKKREQAKTEFIVLLKEKSVDRRARWVDVKKKVDSDPRYKAVENSVLREDYFREYCKLVKDERKKEKEGKEKEKADRDRSSKKDKKDKDKDKDKEKDKDGKKDKKREKEADTSTELDEPKAEAEAEGGMEAEDDTVSEDAEAKERAARAVKERAKEVQRVLANSLRDRDKERQHHQRDEAVQHFNALLADLVRNPDLSWRDAKKQLKKDHRYGLAELLSKDDKERLFSQHISAIAAKRRDKLHLVLTELGISCDAAWGRVKTQLREHAQAPTYSSTSQMEREFRDYVRDKQAAAKTQLRQLLQETRCISHRSRAMLAEGPAAAAPLQRALQPDPRYTALDHIPEERQAIIDAYLEELEKKGPPPPPTATEPTRRSKQ